MKRDYAAVAEDAEWMLDTGESPVMIAIRAGYANPASLAEVLARHGHSELARRIRRRSERDESRRYQKAAA
jgi:hypothetical protein